MAKKPTKKVDVTIKTKEQVVAIAQELGIDTSTINSTSPVGAIQTFADESNTNVAKESQNDVQTITEPLDVIVDDTEPVLRDSWGRIIPTKKVLFESVNFNTVVNQVLYAAHLAADLDPTYKISTGVPTRVQMLFPLETYDKYLANEGRPVYNEKTDYLKIQVKGFDRYQFFKNIVKVGKEGAQIELNRVAQRKPFYSVPVVSRNPIEDKSDTKVAFQKIHYLEDELSSFNMAQLNIIADWHNLAAFKHKDKAMKAILKAQEDSKK